MNEIYEMCLTVIQVQESNQGPLKFRMLFYYYRRPPTPELFLMHIISITNEGLSIINEGVCIMR